MKFEKNDPRLTAYVLNELSNAERAEIEKALQTSAELRGEVESLKKTLGVLQSTEKHDDAFFSLTDKQRDQIFAQVSKSEPTWFQKFVKGPWGYATVGLVTASFALMIYSNNSLNESLSKREQIKDEIQIAKDQMMEGAGLAGGGAPAAPTAPVQNPTPKAAVADSAAPSSGGAGLGAAPSADLDISASRNDDALSEEAQPIPENEILADKEIDSAAAAKVAPPPEPAQLAQQKKAVPESSAKEKFKPSRFGAFGMAKGKNSLYKSLDKEQNTKGSTLGLSGRSFPIKRQISIDVNPGIDIKIKNFFESYFSECFKDSSFSKADIEFKWDKKNSISELQPDNALTSEMKRCLSNTIQSSLGDKSNTFVFKLNIGSK